MKSRLFWILPLFCCLQAAASAGSTLNCGTRIVRVGDTVEQLHEACGEPESTERETRTFVNGGTLGERCFTGTVTIDRWIYKRGGGIPREVTVVEGKVERIRRFELD